MSNFKYLSLLAVFFVHLTSAAQTQSPTFEVATIRLASRDSDPGTGTWSTQPDRFTAQHVPLMRLLMLAYDVDSSQVANLPSHFESELYDVSARPEEGVALTRENVRPRLRRLLAERFNLVVHTEVRSSTGYALVVGKSSPHLQQTSGDHFAGFRSNVSPGHMSGFNWSMPIFAKYLTSAAGFPVVDQTGIIGSYDISFTYTPDSQSSADNTYPPLNEALKKATGLILKPQKVPVETVVVDASTALEDRF